MGDSMAYEQRPKNKWDKESKNKFTAEDSMKEKRKKESDRRRSKRKRDNYYDKEEY